MYSDTSASLVRPKRSRRSALHLLNQVYLYNQRLQDIKTLLEEKDSKVTVVSLAEYYKNERENWRPMTSTNVMSNLSNDALYEALVTINEMFFGSKLSGDGGMVALEGQA